VTIVLPITDEGGTGIIEIPVTGSSLGYTSLRVFNELGAGVDIPNIPAASPPSGKLPYYDSNGSTLLGYIDFDDSEVGLGYETMMRAVESAAFGAMYSIGMETTWTNADQLPTGGEIPPLYDAVASLVCSPVGLEILWQEDSQLNLRIKADVTLTIRTKLEKGAAPVYQAASYLTGMFSLTGLRIGTPRLRKLGRESLEPWTWGAELIFQATYDYPIPRRRSSGSSASAQFEEVASYLQQQVEALVVTPLGAEAHYENSPPIDPSSSDVSLLVRTNQGDDEGSGQIIGSSRPVRRRSGSLDFVVTVDILTGSSKSWRAVDKIVETFTGCAHGAAVFRSPIVNLLGIDGRFWAVQVDCPFYVDEQRAIDIAVPEPI
jgi:hypothetical protein